MHKKDRQTRNKSHRQRLNKDGILPLTKPTVGNLTSHIEPTEVDRTLSFVRMFISSGATTGITKRFTPNSAWRPDPASFAHPATGFAEYQAEYSLYRTIKYRFQIFAVNNETKAVWVGVTNTNADPSTSQSSTEFGNDYCQATLLAAKGGMDRAEFNGTYKVATIVGSRDVETDDDYRGLMSSGGETSPPDLIWLGLTAVALTGDLSSAGVSWTLRLFMTTRIYDRQILTQGSAFLPDGKEVEVELPVHRPEWDPVIAKDKARIVPIIKTGNHWYT